MSPAQDILTRMGFELIGPLKGYPSMDLWEYTVEFAPEKTVHATIPRTPDAQVSWAVDALVEAGAARQRRIVSASWASFLSTLKNPPSIAEQPDPDIPS